MRTFYYFNADIAAKEATKNPQSIYFYDGVPLDGASNNCLNVPIDSFSDYFLHSFYPYPQQISFEGLTLSTDVQEQILTSLSSTINDIQHTRLKYVEELLDLDITQNNAIAMLTHLCSYIASHQLLEHTIPLSIVQKLMQLALFIHKEKITLTQELIELCTSLGNDLQSKEQQMLFIHLQFALSILLGKNVEEMKHHYVQQLALYEDIVDYVEYFEAVAIVFPETEGNDLAASLAAVLLNERFWNNTISWQKLTLFKLYNVTQNLYTQYFDYRAMFALLYPLFEQALQREDEELLFFLHTPLYFTWNRTAQTQQEVVTFHTKVEKVLEQFISEEMVPKYQLQPVQKQSHTQGKKTLGIIYDRLLYKHSVTEVVYLFLKTLSTNKECPYNIIFYNLDFMELGGGDKETEQKFQDLEITYINLHKELVGQKSYEYDMVQKALQTRQRIIDDNVDILIGLNTRVEFNFLFTTRTAPRQVYWSHGNMVYEFNEIDSYISHFLINQEQYPHYKNFTLPIDMQRYNPYVDPEHIEEVRKQYPKESFILGSIGRLIKLDDEEYIQALAKIMQHNPNTIYLACGSGNTKNIEKLLKKYNIEERVYFTGKIDAHLYGHIIDLWLTPFQFGGGEALQEYIYKGKPFVLKSGIYDQLVRMHHARNQDMLTQIDYKTDRYMWENYTEENLANLQQHGYLYPCNKEAQTYFSVPTVQTTQQFIDVANFLIHNPDVCVKIGQEHLFDAKKIQHIFCPSLQEALEGNTKT